MVQIIQNKPSKTNHIPDPSKMPKPIYDQDKDLRQGQKKMDEDAGRSPVKGDTTSPSPENPENQTCPINDGEHYEDNTKSTHGH